MAGYVALANFHVPKRVQDTEFYVAHPKLRLRSRCSSVNNAASHFPSRNRSVYTSAGSYAERNPSERLHYSYHGPSGEGIISGDRHLGRHHYSHKDDGTADYLDTSLGMYAANLELKPSYGTGMYSRPFVSAFSRNVVAPSDTDGAVRNFNTFMQAGAGDRLHYKPSYWHSKREQEQKKALELSQDGYTYYNSHRAA